MIFLTGFMGSGKTAVGRELAGITGRPFVDLDELICEKRGASIPEIFRCAGERAFRALERGTLLELAASGDPMSVVATGGGLPASLENRRVMKACGAVVHLGASFDTIARRIAKDGARPLWNDDARSLLEERARFYADADFTVETGDKTPGRVCREIVDSLPGLPSPVGVALPDGPYPVYIGPGVFRRALEFISRHVRPEGVFVLADENALRFHGDMIRQALAGVRSQLMAVPSGERSKSMDFLARVLDAMFSHGVNRQWICLAVGGGVTGDLAGFAASVYMRGIPIVQAGTTLLAQVDSSIGGKTGINTDYGKNLVGAFHQPLLVISDVDFLQTLDETQLLSAMAEVLKYGIIMDEPLFDYLEQGPPYEFARLVEMCARDKARVVAGDEREGGYRRILNFGHTLGHAVEKTSGYTVPHGRAVAAGMAFASRLSLDLGILPRGDFERIMGLMRRERLLPDARVLPNPDLLARALKIDKKASSGGIHFVLTPAIGGVSVRKLSEIEVLEAYRGFADGYSNRL